MRRLESGEAPLLLWLVVKAFFADGTLFIEAVYTHAEYSKLHFKS